MSDIQLHYIEKGSGQPLILLHGNGESSDYFEHQIAYFSKDYRVIAIDSRGHGQSPRGKKPFTIKQFSEDLSDFIKTNTIEKATILGFSDGGNVAMEYALMNPERVDKLILNGANLFPGGVKEKYQKPIELGYTIAKSLSVVSSKAKKKVELLGLMVNGPYIDPMKLVMLTMPVLVVAGKNDMIKESHTRFISQCFPNAQLAIIEGDHFVANKNPYVFNKVVEEFLKTS